jgi:nucleotide-binding universal stress UspA family protein
LPAKPAHPTYGLGIETQRPVVIGFDHTPASQRVVREAAVLLGPRPAVVVVVWEAGLAFEAATTPAVEAPPVAAGVSQAFAADQTLYDAAQRLAERGAALAEAAGMPATGVAIADGATVADALIRVADENAAAAIAVGAHGRRGLMTKILGSTAKDLLQRAPCPVIVVRDA